MATRDPKDMQPGPPTGGDRPQESQGPNPSRNVQRDVSPGPERRPEGAWSHQPSQLPGSAGPSPAPPSAHEVREGARQMVDQLSQTTEEARESARDFAQRADIWLRQQTDERPWAMVLGAVAAGYVVGGGIPRFALRTMARVGLPVAVAVGVARLIAWEDDQVRQLERQQGY